MWKNQCKQNKAVFFFFICIFVLQLWHMPAAAVRAAKGKELSYAVMIEQEDGSYLLFKDMVEKTGNGKLMVAANLLAERIPGLKYTESNEEGEECCILSFHKNKNIYTEGWVTFYRIRGNKTSSRAAKFQHYKSEVTGFPMVHSELDLLPFVYFSELKDTAYKNFDGILVYNAAKELNKLPSLKKVTIVESEEPEPTPELTPEPIPEHSCFESAVSSYSKKVLSRSAIKEKLSNYGTSAMAGMTLNEYQNIMEENWIDVTQYGKELVEVKVDITKSLPYDSYVATLKKLSRFDGVYLYQIGVSAAGRPMYSIVIDMESKSDKQVLMFTGTTHSREGAGGVFILKQFVDLINEAQVNLDVRKMLSKNKYVAVPIISLDVREELINGNGNFHQGTQLWKAYYNGVDGNRNYIGINCGMLLKNTSKSSIIASAPGYANYPGSYGGSNSETKAMMKWIYHYVVCEQAVFHADYHQQGRIMYGGKPYDTKPREASFQNLANQICTFINSGNTGKYTWYYEGSNYGLNGMGSTLTDYAISCALGAKFSIAFGNMVMLDELNGRELTLIQYKDLDQFPGTYTMANPSFRNVTFEIAAGVDKLGYSAGTRYKLAVEYDLYHYGKLLTYLPKIV